MSQRCKKLNNRVEFDEQLHGKTLRTIYSEIATFASFLEISFHTSIFTEPAANAFL